MTGQRKNVIGYSVIFAMVGQFVNIAIMGIWVSIASIATPFEKAMAASTSEPSLFDKIQNKYDTNNPENNRGDDERLYETLDKYKNNGSSSTSKENDIIQKYYINPGQKKSVDLSKYGNYGADAEQRIENSIFTARDISKSAMAPTATNGGAISTSYSKEGVELTKENGSYTATFDPSKITNNTMAKDEYTSSELTHSQTAFDADQHYGDETQFYAGGQNRIGVLKSGKSSDSTAYQTIQGIRATNNPPEINPDSSIFNFGNKEVNDAIDGEGNWLSSCTDSTTTTSREFTSTTSQTHLCMEPESNNKFYCEVERAAPVVFDVIVSVAGEGKSFLTAKYSLKDQSVSFISPTDSVSTEYDVTAFDGAALCDSGNPVKVSRVSFGVWEGSSIPGETDYSTNLRELQAPSCANGLVGIIQVEDETKKDDTEWSLTAQIRYRVEGKIGRDIQTPAGCYDAVIDELKKVNGLSSIANDITKPDEEPEYPYSFCRFDSYTTLEDSTRGYPDDILNQVGPWYKGDVGNKTWRVNLDGFSCDPTGGVDYCIITKSATDAEKKAGIEDEKECYSWSDIQSKQGQCEIYQSNANCSVVEKTCAEGWFWDRPGGQEDICFAYTTQYQCNEEISTTVVTEKTTNSCAATLPCIGGNCKTANDESNDQFAEALAMASVIQHMEDGMSCDDPSDPSTCRIFEGEGKFCSWEPTGLGNDCCEAPDGIDIFEYASAAYGMLQADAYVAGIEGTSNAVVGTYQSLRQPIADAATSAGEAVSKAWDASTSVFTDSASNLAGNAAGEVTTSNGNSMSILSNEAMEQMQQAVMQYLNDALPDALADALFDAAVDEAGQQTGEMMLSDGASQAASVLGAIYGAYVVYQYIKLAINLLSACHEYEMDMGVRIATKQCISVGEKYCAKDALGVCYIRRQDHCCYDSILARIIMEQASPMLGHDLGAHTGEFIDGSDIRSCPGLTPDQLSHLDWNKIDLSEWISIMLESGIASYDQDVDKLTGSGRSLNNYGREDAVSRNIKKVNETNLADRARETKRIIKDDKVDCSYNPRPFSCYFNNDGGN